MYSTVPWGSTSCPAHFEGVFIRVWIGLLSISVDKLSFAISMLRQLWTALDSLHIDIQTSAKACKHLLCNYFHCYIIKLTSFPTRSSWFSTMPHGAMPIVQIFPLDLEAWSFSASPTWRITPVCAYMFKSVWEEGRESDNKSILSWSLQRFSLDNDTFWCER